MPNRSMFASNDEYNEYFRNYRSKNQKKLRMYKRKYNSDWRKKNGYHNEINWMTRNPEKRKAQGKAKYAVKTGRIFRRACLMCPSNKTVAHHPNYDKPLEIVWLCAVHHRQIHYGN